MKHGYCLGVLEPVDSELDALGVESYHAMLLFSRVKKVEIKKMVNQPKREDELLMDFTIDPCY